ncbi:MAG: hypothetical protein CL943_01285 [Candidatus Diapherotrites archaeon]|uniref:U32 family peptidase n=1 Tax=Candidatus Iainarchaeum sp. TaxID=3101447 RepID=A0A2D6M0I2_9ARCH|nr:hypothetical protein [Candidatus Diapherotrites archaeon]|tara:strand:+ start:3190 stop:3990 length:801 start_codon:yes stop_codon:yes gene_type:complete
MKFEKAILVQNLSEFEKQNLNEFDRVYFGDETCDRLIPSSTELKKAMIFCKKKGLAFSFVTPFCTNQGVKKLKLLLEQLGNEELIVNDFGILKEAAKFENIELVAGRLLNRQYRDPRISLFKGAPDAMTDHLRSSHAASKLFQKLLLDNNVKRVELDNLLQGITTNLTGSGLAGSLYYPCVFIAATRFCLTANCDKLSHSKKIGIFPCKRECAKYSFSFEGKEFDRPLLLFGNALYFENNKIPKNLFALGVNRLVFTGTKQLLSKQ